MGQNLGAAPYSRNPDNYFGNDSQLRMAQESLSLLKSKMARSQQDSNYQKFDNQRKTSVGYDENLNPQNPNYRRIQTFGNQHGYGPESRPSEASRLAQQNTRSYSSKNDYTSGFKNGGRFDGASNGYEFGYREANPKENFQGPPRMREDSRNNRGVYEKERSNVSTNHHPSEVRNGRSYQEGISMEQNERGGFKDTSTNSRNDRFATRDRDEQETKIHQRRTKEILPPTHSRNYKSNFHNEFAGQKQANPGKKDAYYEDPYNVPVDNLPIRPKATLSYHDVEDDEDTEIGASDDNVELIECAEGCGRRFSSKVLEKHENICRKVFQSKRNKFDMTAQRLRDKDGKPIVNIQQVKKEIKEKPKKKEERKIPKWKLESAALRTNIKQSKGIDVSNTEEAKLASDFAKIGLVNCPSCGRNFSEQAGSRHIPVCAERAKAGRLKPSQPALKNPPSKLASTDPFKETLTKKETLTSNKTTAPSKREIRPKKR